MSILMFWPSLGQIKDRIVSASVGRTSFTSTKVLSKVNGLFQLQVTDRQPLLGQIEVF